MDTSKQVELLIDIFEKLKPHINDCDCSMYEIADSIRKTIQKMFDIDKSLAIDMWVCCLTEFSHYDDDRGASVKSYIIERIFNTYLVKYHTDDTIKLISEYPVIKTAIFEKHNSSSVYENFFGRLISTNRLFELDEYLHLLENNYNLSKDNGFDELLITLTSEYYIERNIKNKRLSNDCVLLLLEHAKFASEQSQAIINMNLFDYM